MKDSKDRLGDAGRDALKAAGDVSESIGDALRDLTKESRRMRQPEPQGPNIAAFLVIGLLLVGTALLMFRSGMLDDAIRRASQTRMGESETDTY